jgi:hypothetical protein
MPTDYKKYIPIAIVVISILVIISILYYYIRINKEGYFYNKLDRAMVITILSKSCNLTLRDYVNILNSTNNLRTLFLQELCNNKVCVNYKFNPYNDKTDEQELLQLIKSVAGDCIIKCVKSNDVYRLALVNLKINDIMAGVLPDYPIFRRSLTNRVYGVESVNIYIGNKQENVQSIVDLTMKTINNMNFNDQQILENVNKVGLSEKDAELYKNYVLEFLNKLNSNKTLMENKNNNKDDFSVELFNIVSTLNLYNIFLVPSLNC